MNSYYIVTFGCAANLSDGERIAASYEGRGFIKAGKMEEADHIVINTCMVRESAENRVYGLVNNLSKLKIKNLKLKIVLTGCMVGMAIRDKTGKLLERLRKKMPEVDEFLPIEEVGFEYSPVRADKKKGLVVISNGCNNFCTYCVVPFTRGREVSRSFEEIIKECEELAHAGYEEIMLIGQNVNSYGSDLILGAENIENIEKTTKLSGRLSLSGTGHKVYDNKNINPVYVKHLGRLRIPTLFPYLLAEVSKIPGIKLVDFLSSNPWDFSDELIDVIAGNKNITRSIHLPVQSGDDEVLKRMNRWYSSAQYLKLVRNLKLKIINLKLSTDIIVGFPGETEKQFENTVDLCRKVGFYKAYVSIYSDRKITAAAKVLGNDVPFKEKKRRWQVLENLINQPNFKH
ncbi:MAG: (Dimethylallyl)adenosine tRNA methylthiotransferase MiaB [Candidatus Gottesmanbacteria bacterium GW2011_GWC2_39_8]|uniref:(Dimethylallyl)adenosine tRNA methylthiotransferase MiaB n=1 Tax=Candidatus Gottesmanbacteria bacterium GW2011_GWC2_39_8 TaxID=1618450 RepID=A0A0G0Q6U5_9BACT|nr:MAG: (Dimethylallyl)adenosine tRNA methylthiotransferase MiaB [Candidatus Gottesmanbacteria bacterium GW2011_GWC2_39_8]